MPENVKLRFHDNPVAVAHSATPLHSHHVSASDVFMTAMGKVLLRMAAMEEELKSLRPLCEEIQGLRPLRDEIQGLREQLQGLGSRGPSGSDLGPWVETTAGRNPGVE